VSTVVRPSGPLPARVYWVRRLLMLAVVLALVWAVVRLVGGSDPASGEPRSSDPASEATDASEASQAPEAEETRRARTPREIRQRRIRARQARQAELRRLQRVQTVTPALSSPTGPCDLSLVQVDAQVPEPAYAGTAVSMRIELRTQQLAACTLELTPDRLLLSIVSGDATIWTSTRCPDAVPQRTVVLRPHWMSTVDLQWSARPSGRRCSTAEDFAAPGDYELRLAALTGEPASVPFALVDPAPVAPPPVAPPPVESEPGEDAQADGVESSPDDQGSGESSGSPDGRVTALSGPVAGPRSGIASVRWVRGLFTHLVVR